MQAGEMLTYAEVEEKYGIKVSTLYSLVHQKRIPHVRLGRRFIRFSVPEVEAWVASHRVAGANGTTPFELTQKPNDLTTWLDTAIGSRSDKSQAKVQTLISAAANLAAMTGIEEEEFIEVCTSELRRAALMAKVVRS